MHAANRNINNAYRVRREVLIPLWLVDALKARGAAEAELAHAIAPKDVEIESLGGPYAERVTALWSSPRVSLSSWFHGLLCRSASLY